MNGFNTGFWETAITFATKDKVSCDILGGSFIGEISNSNEKLLPPPRLYTDSIETGKSLYLPKTITRNSIFPKRLASYLTTEELTLISSPPKKSLPGFEVKMMPKLALTDLSESGEIKLGKIADHSSPVDDSYVSLSLRDLNKHLFVCGLTGSGKTTTIRNVLKSLVKNDEVHFLVLESAKKDYRQLLGDKNFENQLSVSTIGDATVNPIRFNPFYIQKNVHPLTHIDYLKAIFNASFSLYGPMPHILEKCLHSIYIKKGWNLTTGQHPNFADKSGRFDDKRYEQPEHYYCYPKLSDLKDEVNHYVKNELEYRGELSDNIRTAIVARLESLCIGAKGLMFDSYDFYPIEKLLNKNVIFEMESLSDDDDKAFFVGLVLVLISEYRQLKNPAINPGEKDKGLQHFLVIEEAHRLLKNVTTERTSEFIGNPKGKAVEVFCNVISEMRSLGQGVGVVEQMPTKISPDVIKNSNTKIVHRLVSKDDQDLLAGSLNISDDDSLYLNRLKTGHALCHKEGMERPLECCVTDDVEILSISDDYIKKSIPKGEQETLHLSETYEISNILKSEGKELTIKFINSLFTIETNRVQELIDVSRKEVRKLLLLKNCRLTLTENLHRDFIVKEILELLNKGVYCTLNRLPDNLRLCLNGVIMKPNEEARDRLNGIFKVMWNKEPRVFIEEVVDNLVCKFIKESKSKENILSVTKSFFLLCDENTVKKISDNLSFVMEVDLV